MMEALSDVAPRFKHPTVQAVEKIESTSELLGAASEKIGSANLRAKMRSCFQKFAGRPQMESQLENTGGARCFQMESERSAVSAMAHKQIAFWVR